MLTNMRETIKSLISLISILTVCVVVFGAESDSKNVSKDFTSKAKSVDEWLFSEGLFPGHAIPKNVAHTDAVKMFTKLVDDHDLLSEAYNEFRTQHNKTFEGDLKYDARKLHFKDNIHFIFQHNLNHDVGQYGFQVGVNRFVDMSTEEMTLFLGATKIPVHNLNSTGPHDVPFAPPHQAADNVPPSLLSGSVSSFPAFFDLRDLKAVSRVKNQKKCGSCVHFAHGAMIETLYALQNDGEFINVSEQMMLDCAIPEYGYLNNGACNGNTMEDSGQFLVDHGVTTEELYKYMAKQENCTMKGKSVIAQLKNYYHVEPTVESFKSTLYIENKPIAAAFLVHRPFMFYRTGVYDLCTPPHAYIGGHAVLITGYGHFFDNGYWVVKNSWGEGWGERGFFKYLTGSNFCGFERWGFTGTLA